MNILRREEMKETIERIEKKRTRNEKKGKKQPTFVALVELVD